jgi:hypothetical protein
MERVQNSEYVDARYPFVTDFHARARQSYEEARA